METRTWAKIAVVVTVVLVLVVLRLRRSPGTVPGTPGSPPGGGSTAVEPAEPVESKKYDDASWHYGGDFPEDLPNEAGAVPMGLYLAWALEQGLGAPESYDKGTDGSPTILEELRAGTTTPAKMIVEFCDEKFGSMDLNDEGNAFTRTYYGSDSPPSYFTDLEGPFSELDTLYRIEDSMESVRKLTPILNRRLAEWRASRPR